MVSVDSVTTTSISLSWSVPSGSVVESYEVQWSSDQCPEDREDSSTTLAGGSYNYNISHLRPGTNYTVSVTASNSAGQNSSGNISMETKETSMFFASTTLWNGQFHQCVFIMALLFRACVQFTYLNLHSAPTAAPSNVSVTDVTSSTITVQWEMVPCIHQNGPITGYSVRYGVMGSGSTQTETVSGTQTITSNLSSSSTNYSIEVAAINSAGTGVYSYPQTTVTDGMKQ